MGRFFWLTGFAAIVVGVWKALDSESREKREVTLQQQEGFSVSRTRGAGGHEVVRFRGSYDDIMRALGVVQDEKPPLPESLEVDSLPVYHFGCPHCGAMSISGENMWRYKELSRTRGYMDNTTTYLAKCKKCNGFMKATVDHDD